MPRSLCKESYAEEFVYLSLHVKHISVGILPRSSDARSYFYIPGVGVPSDLLVDDTVEMFLQLEYSILLH